MSEGDNTSVYIYNGVGVVPEDVSHVRVDPSVTAIPARTFEDCKKLEEVELPEGLIRIGDWAFAKCTSLRSINIPSSVLEIHRDAFSECYALDGINLPEGLQRLDYYAFHNCNSLRRIHIPPNLERIGRCAFLYCRRLSEVALSEGLEVIEKHAFAGCKMLSSANLPSSLNVIEVESFEGCLLNGIHVPDAIETIETGAFKGCIFTNFRMPSSIGNDVDISILTENTCLVSLELPENVAHIEFGKETNSLRNIVLGPGYTHTMWIPKDLKVALLGTDVDYDDITEALRHRFDNLPIHKICYYQSYHENETTMQHLRREINPWTSNPPGQLNRRGKQQDCLGMTSLHILACSTKQNVEMFRLLIEKYPETLIMKDKWGDIPLLYAIWCNAPTEVLDLLIESYKSLYPDYEFDWKGMVLTMANRDVPLANIQKLVNTQVRSFSDQEYDMQLVVLELAASNATQASLYQPFTTGETFRYLLEVSITKRLELLDVKRFQEDLKNSISILSGYNGSRREVDTKAVYRRLATYESIKEGTSVLELALWKAKIDEGHIKRAKVDGEDISYKVQCRVNSGADIVIRNVLPYLLPKLARSYRWNVSESKVS